MRSTPPASPRWYVISLRPQGMHGPLRRVARAAGLGVIPLSPWRIQQHDDPDTRAALRAALAADATVFTSPAAVQAASRLAPLHGVRQAIGVGEGTAIALRGAGVAEVVHPARMDSEGLLGLAALRDIAGRAVGLVTAPGGRGMIEPGLLSLGARVLRADVYARHPCSPSTRARSLLHACAPLAVALSSGEALRRLLDTVTEPERARLRTARIVAGSERLGQLALELGFADIVQAEGPRPAQLVAALNRDGG